MDMLRLRDRPLRVGMVSDTLYVRGVSRQAPSSELQQLLSLVSAPRELDFSGREHMVAGVGGQVWAKYESVAMAEQTIRVLHTY